MRIGIDIRELEKGTSTGIGKYLSNFLNFAYKYDTANEYVLFGNQHTRSDLNFTGMKIKIIPEFFTFWWDQKILSQQIKKENIQLFYSPYFKGPLFSKAKLITTIHDLNPLFIPISMKEWFKDRIYFRILLKLLSRKVDKIITVSQYSKKNIVKYFRVPEEKIEVVYNSVTERYYPINFSLGEVTSKYRINKKFILYIGNFSFYKNVEALIKAYYRLPQKTKDEYQLVIGGKRDKQCLRLERMVERLKLNERLVFTGFISEEDLPAIYSAAELFVFPSLHEGFGLPPLEAMACGTPVITSNTTSLPEVVGEAGILVNPYDKESIAKTIIKMLRDSKLRNKLIQKGINRAKFFPVKSSAEKLLNIFKETYHGD